MVGKPRGFISLGDALVYQVMHNNSETAFVRLALIGSGSNLDDFTQVAWRLRGAVISAVIHPDPAIARSVAKQIGAAHVVADLDDLFANHGEAVDAVVIHSASGDHAPLAQQAAEGGKHVLVETPLGFSTASADTAINAAYEMDVVLMVGQYARFRPAHVEVKGALDAGKLGQPVLLRIHCWKPPEHVASATPDHDTSGWRRIVREIDLANWMFGNIPTDVFAVASGQRGGCQPNDYFQVHLGFAGGGMAIVDYCSTLPAGSNYFSLSLIGSAGAAYADDHRNMHLLYRDGGSQAVVSSPDGDQLIFQLQEFVDVIRTGCPPANRGADGRAAILVAQTADESIRTRRALRLAGECYEPV